MTTGRAALQNRAGWSLDGDSQKPQGTGSQGRGTGQVDEGATGEQSWDGRQLRRSAGRSPTVVTFVAVVVKRHYNNSQLALINCLLPTLLISHNPENFKLLKKNLNKCLKLNIEIIC